MIPKKPRTISTPQTGHHCTSPSMYILSLARVVPGVVMST